MVLNIFEKIDLAHVYCFSYHETILNNLAESPAEILDI